MLCLVGNAKHEILLSQASRIIEYLRRLAWAYSTDRSGTRSGTDRPSTWRENSEYNLQQLWPTKWSPLGQIIYTTIPRAQISPERFVRRIIYLSAPATLFCNVTTAHRAPHRILRPCSAAVKRYLVYSPRIGHCNQRTPSFQTLLAQEMFRTPKPLATIKIETTVRLHQGWNDLHRRLHRLFNFWMKSDFLAHLFKMLKH